MTILALCGPLRSPTSTRRGLEIALAAAARAGAETGWLSIEGLPFCDGRDGDYGPEVAAFRAAAASADALLIGSPEYHGSMSGVLKNALDLLGPDELRGSTVGLLATARGDAGAMNALSHMSHVARWMNALVLPTQVSVPRAHERLGPEVRADTRARLEQLGRELRRYAALMRGS